MPGHARRSSCLAALGLAILMAAAPDARGDDDAGVAETWRGYDFVPGERILFEDDFGAEQDGEFPSHWDLDSGQALVNRYEGGPTFLFTRGDPARVRPLIAAKDSLTDPFTVECDFYANGGAPPVVFLAAGDGRAAASVRFGRSVATSGFARDTSAAIPHPDEFASAWHHVAMLYRQGRLECYLDQDRLLVVPRCGFVPARLAFGGTGSIETPIALRHVRVAAGGGADTLGPLLADGRLVTHAITFEPGGAELRPGSMGFLNQLARFLGENATLRLEIDAWTDAGGDPAADLERTRARAEAVKARLVAMGVDGARLATRGRGAAKPAQGDDTPEGRAAERRIELVRI